MKKLIVVVTALVAVGGGVWYWMHRVAEPDVFSLAEAEACLLDADKEMVGEAVELIKEYEAARERDGDKISEEDAELFDKAFGMVKERYRESRKDESAKGRRRSAALAWVGIDFTYNNMTGTCACWVMFAAQLGLAEAQDMIANPPEKLRGYLLPPSEPGS